ncbi:hypothetical protein AVEN_245846-1 [Araneus ventricosus]|uniref:Uncharacterized protein n=1 Tax=Araneus ventricosus TaxID=182803 RepID=A0A4Y2TS44_ARAVE|nr:hypothetical protein AVEN_245846-1 [Araneus ventricosus]
MEEVGADLENDSSTATSLIEDFLKTTVSQDILEEISPLPSSSNKDRKSKKSVQVKRSKLITPRTSKEDLKMKLKPEEEKRRRG